MLLGDPPDDREPQTTPGHVAHAPPVKAIEHALTLLRRDPGTVVDDFERRTFSSVQSCDVDSSAAPRIAQRIVDEVRKQRVQCIVLCVDEGAGIAAKPGYPTVIVPFGLVTVVPPQNAPFPQGFTPAPAPFGVSFTGTACSEPRLIELA